MSLTLVVAPDFYGRTPVLEELTNLLIADRTIILDPYENMGYFTDRPSAHAHFTAQGGVETYGEKIFNFLEDVPPWEGKKVLLGFSAGASALWSLGERLDGIDLCIGYYGRQIRHYTQIRPRFDTELIFPESDPEYEVDWLISTLLGRKKLELKRVAGLHGFMNPLSQHWDPELARTQIRYINNRLKLLTHVGHPH